MSVGRGSPSLKVCGVGTSEAGRVIVVVGSVAEKDVRGWRRGMLADGRLWRRVRRVRVGRCSLSSLCSYRKLVLYGA